MSPAPSRARPPTAARPTTGRRPVHARFRPGFAVTVLVLAVPAAALSPAPRAVPAPAQAVTRTAESRAAPGPASTPAPPELARVERHVEEFQRVADRNGGRRASGTPGYDASLRYAESLLKAAGYRTRREEFPFLYTETLKEELILGTGRSPDVVVAGYAPSTPAAGLRARFAVLTGGAERAQGCAPTAYEGARAAEGFAVVRAGGCGLDRKERLAAGAGARALLVVNEAPGPPHGWLTADGGARLPVGGVSPETGRLLAREAAAGRPGLLTLRSRTERRRTANLLATAGPAASGRTVVAGAHLDSVPDGPGINDNGVAAAVLLETALHAAPLTGAGGGGAGAELRFAFWAAEEFGLLGSRHHVASLGVRERARVRAYLNLEMVGSPNYGLYVLGAAATAPGPGQTPAPGSAGIERRFRAAFAALGARTLPAPADGRSDYVPFVAAGIPTGGLYGGSFEPKTAGQARLWGGRAGAPHDPCYHLPCDRSGQYSRRATRLNSAAFWRVWSSYALTPAARSAHPGPPSPPVPAPQGPLTRGRS
ncbi:M28 family peptidase [Streptomyces sp. NPDC049954]|uniref:M28 family peptidase n=1 Tax=Streptomyces sp. NPDC049954 TaxID=3155779 RepID=UPI0034474487